MTPPSDAERWRGVESLFYAALELQPVDRLEFLHTRCEGDSELREEVVSLLEACEKAGGFLATPVCGAVKEVVAQAHLGLAQGARINHYEVLSSIGAGGMG